MTAFLLLSDLVGNFVQSAGLGTAARVFATLILEDCFTASNCDVDSQVNMAHDLWLWLLCEPLVCTVLKLSAGSLVTPVQAFGSNFSINLIDQVLDLGLWGLNRCNNCFFESNADDKTEEEAHEIRNKYSVTLWLEEPPSKHQASTGFDCVHKISQNLHLFENIYYKYIPFFKK